VEDDYSDLDDLQVLKVEGKDKAGRRILRIVGKHFPGKNNTVVCFMMLSLSMICSFCLFLK
jgi:hypothetical protein